MVLQRFFAFYNIDVGEGYYEPIYSIIYTYDGQILRTPDKQEVEFIIKKSRYNPNKLEYTMKGEKDEVIQKVGEYRENER